jgi:cold shock CspA family protein
MKGTIARWVATRGFGFIMLDERSATHTPSQDIFAHVSAIPAGLESLPAGMRVTYELSTDIRGRVKAVLVRPIEQERFAGLAKAARA